MSFFAKLAVLISANTTEFKAGLDDATKSTKKFEAEQKRAMRESAKAVKELENNLRLAAQGATVAAAVIGAAFNYADKINDTAKAFDLTIGSLLAMRGALQGAGGEADNMSTLLQKLANTAQSAREGTDKTRAAFDQLGISGKEVENLELDELFALVAQALSKIEDPVKRNAAAFELLGKAAKGVDWKQYWSDYSQGKGTTEQVSAAVEAGAEAWDNLEKAGRKALETLLVLIKPVADFINFLAKASEKTRSGSTTGSLFDAEFGGAFGMSPGDIEVSPGKPPAAAATKGKVKPGGYTTPPASQAGFPAAVEAVRQQTKEIMRQVGAMIKREEMQSKFIAMTRNEREIAQEVFKIQEERDKLVANAEKEIELEKKKQVVNQDRIKALQDQIEVIKFAKQTEIDAITEIIQKRQEEQQSFSVGWERAFKQYSEDSQNYARLGEQAFNMVISNMDMALTEFVQTGSFNFKKLANSIIQDLIRIQLRMQAMQLFSYAKGFVGQAFGFGTQAPAPSIDVMGGPVLTAADGGSISGPTLVGEQGPELFIPNRPGTVIPNQQLSSYMGGQPQIVYNGPYIASMSAIDTQSAVQFLAQNKQAVYAANLSATRSLPASR